MNSTARVFFRLSSIAMFCAFGMIVGCSEPREPASVKSEDLTLKVPAIKEDVAHRTGKDVPLMVRDLDNDDSAVRFYAIEGLRRLTGNDFGYRYYDDDDQRKPAVDRWNTWLKSHDGK